MASSETDTEEGWEPEREHSSAVDAEVSRWRQGDVAEFPLSVWVADKVMPLTPEQKNLDKDSTTDTVVDIPS